MTTVLLLAVVLLLLAVLVLLLTGWPGRVQKEIERTGMELRRELSQHRADSLQFLHAMRIELEESLRETLEEQLDSFAALNSRSSGRRKKQPSGQPPLPMLDDEVDGCDEEDSPSIRRNGHALKSAVDERQLLLFTGVTDEPGPEDGLPADSAPVKAAATFTCDIDDIPDVADLPDYEDL